MHTLFLHLLLLLMMERSTVEYMKENVVDVVLF